MNKIHIAGILIIAISIGAIITSLSNSSTYADFREAALRPGSEFHVVGKLDRNRETVYDPRTDANIFTFYMVDNGGVEKKVILHKGKPQDFEHSEQIVIIGKCNGDAFDANDILMKCPSKYNDGKPSDTQKL